MADLIVLLVVGDGLNWVFFALVEHSVQRCGRMVFRRDSDAWERRADLPELGYGGPCGKGGRWEQGVAPDRDPSPKRRVVCREIGREGAGRRKGEQAGRSSK